MVDPSPINIGGQPDRHHIVGRDDEVSAIWQAFRDGASVILTGERRIGKSWVAKALVLDPETRVCVVYLDVEKHAGAAGVFDALRTHLVERLPVLDRTREKVRDSGIEEIQGIPLPRTHQEALAALPRLLRSAASKVDGGVAIILDELPTLLKTMVERSGGPDEAVDLLRTLRSLRQEEPTLRLVFAGSIGLHHVLAEDGAINDAVNEMLTVPVGPLRTADARLLASRLLVGIGLPVDPDHPLAGAVAEAAEGIAYYVQLTVQAIRDGDPATITPADVLRIRDEALAAADDPWRMQHYVTRIKDYFGPDAGVAYAVLDRLAMADLGLELDALASAVATHPSAGGLDPAADRDRLIDVVRRPELDHYLRRLPATGGVQFQYELVRRGWRARRYL